MSGLEMLYLSRADVVRAGVSMDEILGAVESMFREKGEGRTEMPPKTTIHPGRDAFLNAMPAYLPKIRAAGVKWVSSFPDNARRGLPSISAVLILNDPENGLPLALMDATWITAQRTGAASAVAAKFLARPEAAILGVVGCGVQGFSHVEAFRGLFSLRRIKAFDLRPEASATFARKVEEAFGIKVDMVASAEDAVGDSDLIVTAGAIREKPDPFIREEWFAPGSFASAVDYDSAWTGAAMQAADVFVTDDTAQVRAHREQGYFREVPARIVELADVVTGRVSGRSRPQDRVLVMNLGIALADMAVGSIVLAKARAAGLGLRLPL
jgi:ornithine cyclodeaminase/alanine dehydrogenase-like protein (mu-crystallin family)